MEVAEVPGDGLAEVVGGTIGRRGPTAMGEIVPPEAPGFPGSGLDGGGCITGGFGPVVITTPVPLRVTVCGLPVASSKIVTEPVLVPAPSGLKVTEICSQAPAHMVFPQVLVWEKSPPVTTLKIASEALPVLVRAIVWGLLLVPTT